ncbi:gas vesicle protein GvpO [Streptomyces meridianus]|uniref:Gas vesicle protein n=1 Tax=Streptomyces meridianus TaxID=2938945 RepID=A0ABT0XBR4_9ACTN|nr:gas vesicle protein [Streptomyces meridianus]MCM2579969.1 gas vesicle protein [Streptomyces meridianus]
MTEQREGRTRTASKTTASRRTTARGPQEAARRAGDSLTELIGHPLEGVSAVCRTEQGWRVHVDVMEVPRIPDTTSLLATYEVEIDQDGELMQYRRVRRYRRGWADD